MSLHLFGYGGISCSKNLLKEIVFWESSDVAVEKLEPFLSSLIVDDLDIASKPNCFLGELD